MLQLIEIEDCCSTRSQGHSRKLASIMSWFLPSALLLMIPKCPLCIVAYTALLTGIGISVSSAAGIRLSLILGCLCLLIFAMFRILFRLNSVAADPTVITDSE
jgi:hypothetical protein